MKTPAPITTPVRRLSLRASRECQLVQKRAKTGLTAEEQAALTEIYREQDAEAHRLTEQDVDALAEERGEARLFSPTHPNIHE